MSFVPVQVPPIGWEDYPSSFYPLLMMLRGEVEEVFPGVKSGPLYRNSSWDLKYWYGLNVYYLLASPPFHVGAIFISPPKLMLHPAGCFFGQGEQVFDLNDPGSIPDMFQALGDMLAGKVLSEKVEVQGV